MAEFRARPALILASSSPRRQSLLRQAGYPFEVIPPHDQAESGVRVGESIESAVRRLALDKAADVANRLSSGLVLAADTLVECDGELIGKPADRADARRILQQLTGKSHRVLTGICLWNAGTARHWQAVDETLLQMCELTVDDLEAYLDSGRWEGKAGAFGYQDGNDWVHIIRGSESNVVGLPLERLESLLQEVQPND